MPSDLRNIIARGLCSFNVNQNRNRDMYGSLIHTEPEQPCGQICDNCWHQANHLIVYIEEWINDKQPTSGHRQPD